MLMTHLLDSVVGESIQDGVEDDGGHGEEVAGGKDEEELVLVGGGVGLEKYIKIMMTFFQLHLTW